MPRLPRLTASDIERIITRFGFIPSRQRGSHKIFYNESTKKRITLPMHGNSVVHPKILKQIIEDCGAVPEDFS